MHSFYIYSIIFIFTLHVSKDPVQIRADVCTNLYTAVNTVNNGNTPDDERYDLSKHVE